MAIAPESQDPNTPLPSIGELERRISQALQKLWRQQTGQFPEPAITLFFEKKLVVWLGNVLTPLELTLANAEQHSILERKAIDQIMKEKVRQCLARLLRGCVIKTVLIDTDLEENCAGIVVMLDQLPAARNVSLVPKHRG